MKRRLFGSATLLLATMTVSAAAGRNTARTIPAAPATTGPAALYQAKCAVCHAAGDNPGYLGLKQLGQPQPDLTKRKDLDADYVRAVVRNGVGQMPALTAGYVGERELDSIALYLAGAK